MCKLFEQCDRPVELDLAVGYGSNAGKIVRKFRQGLYSCFQDFAKERFCQIAHNLRIIRPILAPCDSD